MLSYPSVSVVVPTHNRKDNIVKLIQSLRKSEYPYDKIETIVVDDASTDSTAETLQKLFPEVRVIRNVTEKFPSASRNLGIKSSQSDFVFLIDDDNVIDKNGISGLVKVLLSNSQIGLAGPISLYNSRHSEIWCAGGQIRPPLFINRHLLQNKKIQDLPAALQRGVIEVDYVPNAFMVRREIIDRGGVFDENLPIGWEEIDLAFRIKNMGYKIVVSSKSRIFHDVSFSRDVHINSNRAFWRGRNRVLFYRKHLPFRSVLIPFDVLGFLVLVLKLGVGTKNFWKYANGVKAGITTKLK
jgi:GT2 family glycosyltransferase